MADDKVKKRSKAQIAKAAAEQKNNAFLEKLDIEYVPIDQVKPNQYNPNRQSEHDFTLLCKSIQEDGFTRPIVVRRGTLEIVDGEHRWRACKALHDSGAMDFSGGIAAVLVDMTDAQARIATLKYNRIHGSEDANLAADVLKEIMSMGDGDWAQDSLMLDDVEMERLTKELAVVETAGMNVAVPPEMLGPAGRGLSATDSMNIDTSADETRAKQAILAKAKAQEETGMLRKDEQTYRLVLFFTGEEAKTVKSALEPAVAANLLAMCRDEAARQSA